MEGEVVGYLFKYDYWYVIARVEADGVPGFIVSQGDTPTEARKVFVEMLEDVFGKVVPHKIVRTTWREGFRRVFGHEVIEA